MELNATDDGKLLFLTILLLTMIIIMIARIDIFRLVENAICSPAGGYIHQIFGSFCSVL